MSASLVSGPVPSRATKELACIPRVAVTIRTAPGEAVVRVAGEANVWRVSELSAALLSVSARRPSLVTLDLSGLSCIAALAMGCLVEFRRGIVRAGGRVRLAPTLQESVREALARAELIDLFRSPENAEVARGDAA